MSMKNSNDVAQKHSGIKNVSARTLVPQSYFLYNEMVKVKVKSISAS